MRPENILAGDLSDLIFLAFRQWLYPSNSRALVLDPTYGEYLHILRQVIGCKVDQFPLHRGENYRVDLQRLLNHCSVNTT